MNQILISSSSNALKSGARGSVYLLLSRGFILEIRDLFLLCNQPTYIDQCRSVVHSVTAIPAPKDFLGYQQMGLIGAPRKDG